MKDTAQCNMALGNSVSAAYISSVNDNMSQSHFHDYFELYFLDTQNKTSAFKHEYISTLTNLILVMVAEMNQSQKGIVQQNITTQIIDYINNAT